MMTEQMLLINGGLIWLLRGPMNANTNTSLRRYRIASVPGDGIGPEVIAAGLEVLEVLAARSGAFALDIDHYDWGSERYRKTGAFMPENALSLLKQADAIYFGAVGAPDVPDHVTLWGLRLPICQRLDQYANIRPTRIFPGVKSPLRGVEEGDLDWLIVRENSEGEYSGHGGRAHIGLPEEVATETSIFTRRGVERIMRFAFREAQKRPRKLLTVVTKSNAQRHGLVLWDEIAAEVAQDFPDVTWDKELVDAMTFRMVAKPKSIDTVVATNLHADILSDLAAALGGSLGIAPTAVRSNDLKGLIPRLRRTAGNVLVVGHSETLPDVMSELSLSRVYVGDDDYDNLFIVMPGTASGPPRMIRLHYR